MLVGLVAALLVVARLNVSTLTTLLLVSVVAGIGLYDDWQKISNRRNEGLSVRYKFLLLSRWSWCSPTLWRYATWA